MDNKIERMKITILETSDVHGAILPINYADNSKKNIGLSKLASVIASVREKEEHVVLIDNGDMIQGTPLTYYYSRIDTSSENPVIKIMNYLKYDGMVLGNHEFNYGQLILSKAKEEANFPFLCANILSEDLGEPYYGAPYIIKEFNGSLRIAILGLITQYVPNWESKSNIEGLEFKNPIDYARRWIKVLKEKEKADVIIVSYHGGFEKEIDEPYGVMSTTGENQGMELCEKVEGIDVLLTGHQHRVIDNKYVNNVLVIQPGSNGEYIGKISLEFVKKEKWILERKEGKLISVDNYNEDEEVKKLIKPYEKCVQRWLDTPIGKIKGNMLLNDTQKARFHDNEYIEFINKVQMEAGEVDISATSLFSDTSKGFNSDVTMRDIVSNYIYPNTLSVIRVKGKDIKDAIEKSAEYFLCYDKVKIKDCREIINSNIRPYNYDMWEGIEYIINISKPIGERVEKLTYKEKDIDLESKYDIVLNHYRASGGGEYAMFRDKEIIKEINIDMSELIANYILSRGEIEATVNNNWKIIY